MVDINVVNFLRIGYHIVTEEINQEKLETYQNLSYETFELVKKLPMNYLQLKNTMRYFLVMKDSFPKIGYFIHRCVESKIHPDLINDISNDRLINFFFFDENVDFDKLKGYFPRNSLRYPIIQNRFETPNDLLELMQKDDALIKKTIQEKFSEFSIEDWQDEAKKNDVYFRYNSFQNNNVGENNYYILNHIIGNYWTKDIDEFPKEEQLSNKFNQTKAVLQARSIDTVKVRICNDMSSPFETSLVLVVPHQKDNKYGQDFDYCFRPETTVIDNDEIKRYFRGLDDIVFQQAIPTFSPIIRTPLIKFENFTEKQLFNTFHYIEKKYKSQIKKLEEKRNREVKLKFQDQKELDILIEKFLKEKNIIENKIYKEIATEIKKLGEILTKKVLNKDLKEYLEQIKIHKGQLVVVSDLPIEYMQLGGLPISVQFNICRINEDEIRKGLDLTKYNDLVIDEKLIQNTLVIFLDKEDKTISIAYKSTISIAQKCKYKFCNSLIEIKNTIEEFNPTLLIFYCHGGYENGESFLSINKDEKLSATNIIEFKIKADMVVLCACNTSPISKYSKIMPNAFLQAGALCVVATYYSVDAENTWRKMASILDSLNNYESINYKNWLSFILDTLKTDIFRDHFFSITEEKQVAIDKLWNIGKRKEAIEKYLEEVRKIDPKIKEFWDLDFDWMYFTILGRADLIYFESYIQRYWRMLS